MHICNVCMYSICIDKYKYKYIYIYIYIYIILSSSIFRTFIYIQGLREFWGVFASPVTIIEGVLTSKKNPQIQSQKVFGAGGMLIPQGSKGLNAFFSGRFHISFTISLKIGSPTRKDLKQ